MKKSILIADDEPHIARILKMTLERAGFSVTTVTNGLVALETIRKQHPDILITDIEMPKMSGQELIEALNTELPDRDFHVIVMTSRTNLEYRSWSDEFKNLMFLEKPVSARHLKSILNKHFALGESA